jgi:hypothetical protein
MKPINFLKENRSFFAPVLVLGAVIYLLVHLFVNYISVFNIVIN